MTVETTRGYRELIVWQKAMQLVPAVYQLVKKLPAEERYALSDQLRRAVVSIPAKHCRGTGAPAPGGVRTTSGHRPRQLGGGRYAAVGRSELRRLEGSRSRSPHPVARRSPSPVAGFDAAPPERPAPVTRRHTPVSRLRAPVSAQPALQGETGVGVGRREREDTVGRLESGDERAGWQ